MNKEDYIKITKKRLNRKVRKIMIDQIENYYKAKEYKISKCNYSVGDNVKLVKGTLLHGTYKNIEGLKEIIKDGLISSWFINSRVGGKYPSSVGVWNLQQDYLLKDYINFYSGGTINYKDIEGNTMKTEVISYEEMKNIMEKIKTTNCFRWYMEQTKEARFLPSLVQDKVQIGIIFNGQSNEIKRLLEKDILIDLLNDKDIKEFINPYYYSQFIKDRKNKNDFFTNRESAILFGIPSNFIEGILVGRIYEKDTEILKGIKTLLPNCYICNLDGKVIMI